MDAWVQQPSFTRAKSLTKSNLTNMSMKFEPSIPSYMNLRSIDAVLQWHVPRRTRTRYAYGYDSNATQCPLLLSSPDTVGQQDVCDWTQPNKPQLFFICLKNAYQIRKRFFFIFSLSFPASEPSAFIVARRRLHLPAQVGPCLFSHLLPISFLVFLAAVSSFFIMNKHYSRCRVIVFWFFSLSCYCHYYEYNNIGMTDLIYWKQVWPYGRPYFFYFSRCRVISFLKGN